MGLVELILISLAHLSAPPILFYVLYERVHYVLKDLGNSETFLKLLKALKKKLERNYLERGLKVEYPELNSRNTRKLR